MKNEGDDIIEEIQDRINIIKANIHTLQANIDEDAPANIISLNIDVYNKNKKKMMTLINQNLSQHSHKSSNKSVGLASEEKTKTKETIKNLYLCKDEATKICNTFETKADLDSLKAKVKESQEINFTNTESLEKLMGDYREAALVINHENRKQKALDEKGEEYKSGEKYNSGKKNKEKGIPKSLRMVDLESEKYQQQRKKKLETIPHEENESNENLNDRTCMRCTIF
ncbi:unnamed protein product [Moneuplotes crassus]|uniref:Uncharacterized protein n=1 Tax=Euplotes crassus TaxID=5936 RepID=A0AAD1XUZ0_EUPCR|nr:unnamed protein product [Moneuplotes crassus]